MRLAYVTRTQEEADLVEHLVGQVAWCDCTLKIPAKVYPNGQNSHVYATELRATCQNRLIDFLGCEPA